MLEAGDKQWTNDGIHAPLDMAHLLLTGFKLFCGLPAHQLLGPIVMTINPLSPLNLLAYGAWLLGVRYGKLFQGLSKGTWKRAAEWAVPFYALTMFIIYLILFSVLCGVATRA